MHNDPWDGCPIFDDKWAAMDALEPGSFFQVDNQVLYWPPQETPPGMDYLERVVAVRPFVVAIDGVPMVPGWTPEADPYGMG